MIVNPENYTFEYFYQPRGKTGCSGELFLGKPKTSDLFPVLVKSCSITEAINEYIGCNLGRKMGINTPRALLFKEPEDYWNDDIDFYMAVGIEFLEGLDESKGASFENEELATQTIKAYLLHALTGESDHTSLARYNGKIYTFDFAEGILEFYIPDSVPDSILDDFYGPKFKDGFTVYQYFMSRNEIDMRKKLWNVVRSMDDVDVSVELVSKVYEDFKMSFLNAYHETRFSDLIQDIETVFSRNIANYIKGIFGAMEEALVSF